MAVTHYRELNAWQRAMEMARAISAVSNNFPKAEQFGLTHQIRRAAISVPSNIAEGQGRGNNGEFVHHLRIANGSRQEVETQLLLAIDLGLVSRDDCAEAMALLEEAGRLLWGLLRSVSRRVLDRSRN